MGKMRRFLKNNEGFALILTILIISLIITLTLQFNSSMRSDLYAASNLRDSIRLGYIAKSGFNWALAMLSADALESDFDSIHEPWMYAKDLSSHSTSMFEEGRFVVEIIDHSGRIQININTADPLVLASLSDEMDEDMVQNMVSYRIDEENNLKEIQWYKQVPEMSHVTIDPYLLTTVSTHFEIRSEGFKEAMHKGVRGMVERREGSFRILSWNVL